MGACGSKSGSSTVEFVTPVPCWVIKTKTVDSNAKVFLNVVKHDKIPSSGDQFDPRLFIGHEKVEQDLKGVECATIDILVHTSVVEGMDSGEHPKAIKLNRDIINLMNAIGRKKDEDQLRITFSVPKILKCYKGEYVSPVDVKSLENAIIDGPDATAAENSSDSTAVANTDDQDGGTLDDSDMVFRGTITMLNNPDGIVEAARRPTNASTREPFSSDTSDPTVTLKEPAEKGAFFRKRGHWMPTMKTRYVHVSGGKIGWYVDASLAELKGEISLAYCEISGDEGDTNNEYQLYIRNTDVSKKKEDLLLEMSEEEMKDAKVDVFKDAWVECINAHIAYANQQASTTPPAPPS